MQDSTERPGLRGRGLVPPELDQVLWQFERALFAGTTPWIETFVPTGSPHRRGLIEELLHIEIEYRLNRREPLSLGAYLQRFPELSQDAACVERLRETVRAHSPAPPPLEQFVRHLQESRVLSADTLRDLLPASGGPTDAEALARELVRQGKLTPFQAGLIWQGKGKSLMLGKYLLLEKIGQGGMGTVFKARHQVMDRIVALKILPPAMMKDASAIARFQREVKAAAKLSHPNIVTAHDADQDLGVHFLVMEHVDGSNLAALVKKVGPLSVSNAVNYITQAARGLEAAHGAGIVHRDIKPSNLVLDRRGTVKILDMGLARIDLSESQAESRADSDLTNTGTVMGTIDYMAPEQALSAKHADERADIYSLGCSLFFLMAGKATYQGDSIMAKMLAHREQPLPNLHSIRADVPEQLDAVFKKMIAKKAEDRYQTAAALLADLEKCSSQHSASLQHPVLESTDASFTNFLFDISTAPLAPGMPKNVASARAGRGKKKLLIGSALLGILAVLVITLKTRDGTLIVNVNEPDAEVQVLDEAGKVEITRKGDKGPITISVDPGKHRLKVAKDGFTVFGEEFELQSGGAKTITARLVPARKKTPAEVAADAAEAKKPWNAPAFKTWMKSVAALPPHDQVKAVSKKLMDLNPGFDGKIIGFTEPEPKIEFGMVTEFGLITNNVTNVSPVRALPDLRRLRFSGSEGWFGRLSDLSPLKGMQLRELQCRHSNLADLSPLRGIPLMTFDCSYSDVYDLSPLEGLQLTSLVCHACPFLSDLSALKGMPLGYLACAETSVSDLTPLKGLPLATLQCSDLPWLKDLSPLRGMALSDLRVTGTRVADLSPLQGMPLDSLWVNRTPVSDLSPLTGMQLKNLNLDYTQVKDLTPLRGMPLEFLNCSGTQVPDLAPLNGLPLTELRCGYMSIADLSPLKDMPLTILRCPLTNVSDLSPLQACQNLTYLSVDHAKVTPETAAALEKALPACRIEWDNPAKRITTYNDSAFQKWQQETAALPADKQIDAVSKKLQELNPGFDGKLTGWGGDGAPAVVDGVVTGCGIVSGAVVDLSPLRALGGLKMLNCQGTQNDRGLGNGRLTDLSPLRGLSLTSLSVMLMPISDLSALQGMPIENLNFAGTNVVDLSPLKGMPLTQLNCGSTNVSDLSPLSGLPLISLACANLPRLSDLVPLKGLSLGFLQAAGTRISDLTPLTGMPLARLEIHYTAVSDLSLLKDLPLQYVSCDLRSDHDLDLLRSIKTLEIINSRPAATFWKAMEKSRQPWQSPAFEAWMKKVAALPPEGQIKAVSKKLVELNPGFDGKLTGPESESPIVLNGVVTEIGLTTDTVANISPLRAFSRLTALYCRGSNFGDQDPARPPSGRLMDLAPLKGLALTVLNCSATRVRDLSPLTGIPLTLLNCQHTSVTDLAPLKGMPLTYVACGMTNVSDLSPLAGMPLTGLNCSDLPDLSDLTALKGMHLTTLYIGGTHVSDLLPLKGMPLERLHINLTRVSDVSLLKDMPLKHIGLDFKTERDTAVLRTIKTLETINNKPAADFWKEFGPNKN